MSACWRLVRAFQAGKATREEVLQATRATIVNEHWRKPILSARAKAAIRKTELVNPPASGEPIFPLKPLAKVNFAELDNPVAKLQKREKRLVEIETKMKEMPRLLEAFRKERREKRQVAKDKARTIPRFPLPVYK